MSSPGWLARMSPRWEIVHPKAVFRERSERSRADDIHLTPSQTYGVLPQAEYMAITGNRVVLNLTGQDNMKHVEPNDFVIHLRSFQGGIEYSTLAGKVSNAYTVLTTAPHVEPRFYKWVLKSSGYIQELNASTNQLRDGQSIKFADFAAIDLPLPPVEEQRRIADFLDDQVERLDQAAKYGSQQVAAAVAALKGRIVETFFTSAGLAVPLRAVAEVAHGMQRSPDRMSGPTMCRYVRTANVKDGVIETTDLNEMNFSPAEQAVYGLQRGDVLVTEASGSRSAVGASAMWTEDTDDVVCFQNHLLRLRPRDASTDSRYLEWWARASHMSGAMEMWATGANILNLGSDQLKRMPVPKRSVNEQLEVARRCSEIESLGHDAIDELNRRGALLEERKRSLITAAVTGEMDVTTAKPINMGRWVPGVGADIPPTASSAAPSLGGI